SRITVLLAAAAAALCWAGIAQAGFAISPASGSAVAPNPTFVVDVDTGDSIATVYVADNGDMSSAGFPSSYEGSCTPSTSTGQPNQFQCTPSVYRNSGGDIGKLKPGVYYWWLSFYKIDAGIFT